MKKYIFLFCIAISLLSHAKKPSPLNTLELTAFQQESLMKLASLYSCARYFNLNTQLKTMDWYAHLEQNIKTLLKETQTDKVDSLLLHQYQPLIYQLSFSKQALPAPQKTDSLFTPFYIKASRVIPGFSFQHITSYIEKKTAADSLLPVPNQSYSFPLGKQLFANYPLALTQLPEQSAFQTSALPTPKKWRKDFYTDPYYRIANAIISDAYIQHFYAYYQEDQLEKTWQPHCSTYLKEVAEAPTYAIYLSATRHHYSAVKDDYLYISNGYFKPRAFAGHFLRSYYSKIRVRLIEGKLCIVQSSSDYPDLKVGDEILRIQGKEASTILQEQFHYVSGSTLASRYDKVCDSRLFNRRKKKAIILITVKHFKGTTEDLQLKAKLERPISSIEDPFITEVEPGIWKINLCCSKKNNYKNFKKHITDFQQAKGLILDIRGYPNPYSILPILSHFIDFTAWVGEMKVPIYYYPNHHKVNYIVSPNSKWGIHPATETWQKAWGYKKPLPVHLTAPVVFLTNQNAMSFSETVLELIKHYKIGTIIGTPTSGTNGGAVICRFSSMGFIFTGHKFLSHTGKRLHGIGIQPDIFCPTTRKDLAEHRDTQVKKACEVIKKK